MVLKILVEWIGFQSNSLVSRQRYSFNPKQTGVGVWRPPVFFCPSTL